MICKCAPTVKEQLGCIVSLEALFYSNLILNGLSEEQVKELMDGHHKNMMDGVKILVDEHKGRCTTVVGDA